MVDRLEVLKVEVTVDHQVVVLVEVTVVEVLKVALLEDLRVDTVVALQKVDHLLVEDTRKRVDTAATAMVERVNLVVNNLYKKGAERLLFYMYFFSSFEKFSIENSEAFFIQASFISLARSIVIRLIPSIISYSINSFLRSVPVFP